MVDERRRDPRVRSGGGVVRCESASGKRLVSRWLDLGTGGLFVETDAPTPVGVLLTLEIEIPGESAPSPAVGRVTWAREAGSADGKPAGMGITFIDVDEVASAAIGRFLEREAPGQGELPPKASPPRERTVLGLGLSAQPFGEGPPLGGAPRPREKTMLGVAPAATARSGDVDRLADQAEPGESPLSADDLPDWPDEPPEAANPPGAVAGPAPQACRRRDDPEPDRIATPKGERSLPIDSAPAPAPRSSPAPPAALSASADVEQEGPLLAGGGSSELPSSEAETVRDGSVPLRAPASTRETRSAQKGGVGRYVVLLLLALSSAAGYVNRPRLGPWIAGRVGRWIASAPFASRTSTGAPPKIGVTSTAAVQSATPTTPTSKPEATANIEVDAATRATPAAPDAGTPVGATKAPAHRPFPHATKRRPTATPPASEGEP